MSSCCEKSKSTKFNLKVKIISFVVLSIFLLSFYPNEFLRPLNENFIDYFSMMWWAILLGLFLGSLIDYFIPDGFIQNHLGKKNKFTIFNSVILGFILSACCHGILALAIQLYKKGSSASSIAAFLLAAPWANLSITVLLFSFFGIKAIYFILGAIIIAIITGYLYVLLEKFNLIEKSPYSSDFEEKTISWDRIQNFHFKKSFKGISNSIIQLSNMVLWWILIGFLIAVFISSYVPSNWILSYFGSDFKGLLTTLGVATIIEVCSEGSAPIAFEIFDNVKKLGNPFVFLMAGVVTDYTEIGLMWSNLGKRIAIWLPVLAVPQVLLFAYLMNRFL